MIDIRETTFDGVLGGFFKVRSLGSVFCSFCFTFHLLDVLISRFQDGGHLDLPEVIQI
jgi:hypothetical protein